MVSSIYNQRRLSSQPDLPAHSETSYVNYHVYMLISAALMDQSDNLDNSISRTELDSHANMPVVGSESQVLCHTGKTASVCPYNPDYAPKEIPIVDAALLYQDTFTGKDIVLVIRNALHVESMHSNLIPPFIMREQGIKVYDTAKIHVNDPDVDDHAIILSDHLRIPLQLHGTFSYFPTRKPTLTELNESEDIYELTPEHFDPHNDGYALNESSMLDWEGNIIEKRQRQQVLLSDVTLWNVAVHSVISAQESIFIDKYLFEDHEPLPFSSADPILGDVSPLLNVSSLAQRLLLRAEVSSMMSSLGSCNALHSAFLLPRPASEEFTGDQADLYDVTADSLYNRVLAELQADTMSHDDVFVSAATARPSRGVSPQHLSRVWRIDVETAEKTLNVTSQRSQRTNDPSLSRNYGTTDRMLRYRRLNRYFYMDTFFATSKGGKSSRGHTCCQLFVTDRGFVYVVPMCRKHDVLAAVKQFAKDIGAPDAIICDAAPEQKSADLKRFLNTIGTTLRVLEEGTPWSNRAELYIGLLKESTRKDMKASNAPLAFWDYCVERRARINNLTAKNLFQLHGSNPHTDLLHEEGDISNLCQFTFYEWVYHRDHNAPFPHNREVLGRVLGPASGEGNEMAQWVLRSTGKVVPRRTVRPLTSEEKASEVEQHKRHLFDDLIKARWGEPLLEVKDDENNANDEDEEWTPYEDPDEPAKPIPSMDDMVDSTGRLINQQPAYDHLLNAEVQLQVGDRVAPGKVLRRVLGPGGEQLGTYDLNPFLNTIMYEVEFDDGHIAEYSASVIAENILSRCDNDGFSTTMLKCITDFSKALDAVTESNMYVTTKNGKKRLRKTTQGWKLLVRWADDTESWIPLADMKESHPVDVAEFAKARGIDKEPAFAWWVPYTLRKRDVIINAVQSRARKVTHKYGIELPTSVAHARELDAKNKNTLWQDALDKEVRNVGVAFEVLTYGKQAPPGWSKVTGHLIWDLKMDFTRKARWVLDGHKTASPIGSTYAGVVSRESVRIAFTYAALNGLDVCAADIQNAYLQAPSSQKEYIICGPEFGLENVGNVALIHRALYGGKSAGRDFRNHLRACMRHLGFVSCSADPDVWMRPAVKDEGGEYWEYILLYTDDSLCISEHPERTLRNELGKYFGLKEESIGAPRIYLGGNVRKVQLETGVQCWAFGSSQYVQAAVDNVKRYLDDRHAKGDTRYRMPAKAKTPMRTSYRPELDVTPELTQQYATYFQSLIGVLRWIVELGRVDVCLECSLLSSHLVLPREGHLEQLLHIFAYLRCHHNAELVFDPTYHEIDASAFEKRDWTTSEFGHLQGKEEIPPNRPQERGAGFVIRAKVDADHASNTVTRRSRTGFVVYVNSALVYWFAKKQTSVESSSFGSEFCAMKTCCEYLRGLRYKLRMMGIPVLGPTYVSGDNQSVLANTTVPESQLKKKSQSIAYHFVREGAARDEWRTSYINTNENEADLLTKMLPSGAKREGFVRRILHHIFRD